MRSLLPSLPQQAIDLFILLPKDINLETISRQDYNKCLLFSPECYDPINQKGDYLENIIAVSNTGVLRHAMLVRLQFSRYFLKNDNTFVTFYERVSSTIQPDAIKQVLQIFCPQAHTFSAVSIPEGVNQPFLITDFEKHSEDLLTTIARDPEKAVFYDQVMKEDLVVENVGFVTDIFVKKTKQGFIKAINYEDDQKIQLANLLKKAGLSAFFKALWLELMLDYVARHSEELQQDRYFQSDGIVNKVNELKKQLVTEVKKSFSIWAKIQQHYFFSLAQGFPLARMLVGFAKHPVFKFSEDDDFIAYCVGKYAWLPYHKLAINKWSFSKIINTLYLPKDTLLQQCIAYSSIAVYCIIGLFTNPVVLVACAVILSLVSSDYIGLLHFIMAQSCISHFLQSLGCILSLPILCSHYLMLPIELLRCKMLSITNVDSMFWCYGGGMDKIITLIEVCLLCLLAVAFIKPIVLASRIFLIGVCLYTIGAVFKDVWQFTQLYHLKLSQGRAPMISGPLLKAVKAAIFNVGDKQSPKQELSL